MKIFYILLIVLLSISSQSVFGQCDSNIHQYKPIGGVSYEPSGKIILESDSTKFDGYLFFELHKKSDKNFYIGDHTLSITEIFFVKKLDDFRSKKERFYYNEVYLKYPFADVNPFDTGYSNNRGEVKVLNSEDENFKELKSFYTKFIDIRDNYPYEYFLLGKMTSILIDTSHVKLMKSTASDIAYFIFRVKFYAGVLKYKSEVYKPYQKTRAESYMYFNEQNFFLPISKAYIFKPVDENILLENGFVKSDWFPDYLYRKCDSKK
ncbi:MAG: hypothetical protein K1X86_11910 [Ignavibacteria bacterium]|nr:hypothetical protein [Ignavibacteria bacterium]